jgi:hypothetical protein
MRKASRSKLRNPRRATAARFRVLLDELRRSGLAAIFARNHNRKKNRQGRRETIHLLLIILVSIVAAIAGLYAGITSSHHHEH